MYGQKIYNISLIYHYLLNICTLFCFSDDESSTEDDSSLNLPKSKQKLFSETAESVTLPQQQQRQREIQTIKQVNLFFDKV